MCAMAKMDTPIHILSTFHFKLCLLLHIPYEPTFTPSTTLSYENKALLMTTIRQQNIIGWDSFLHGYTSIKWHQIIQHLSSLPQSSNHLSQNWPVKLISHAITLYKKIWEDRNQLIHGKTRQEALIQERLHIQANVPHRYKHPPKLAKRYPKIHSNPIHTRLQRSTTHLKQWINRIHHRARVSQYLRDNTSSSQLTLTLRQAYLKQSADVTTVCPCSTASNFW
jgi:hypothetical protein